MPLDNQPLDNQPLDNQVKDRAFNATLEELLHSLYATAATEQRPATTQLLDYVLGLATASEARHIEAALTTDPALRRELAQLQALDQPQAESEAKSTPPTLTARLRSWLQQQWPATELLVGKVQVATVAATRGSPGPHAIYTADRYRLALATIADDTSSERAATAHQIQGQLIDQQDPNTIFHGHVQIWSSATGEVEREVEREVGREAGRDVPREPQLIANAKLDELGFFALSFDHSGPYGLVVVLPTHTIWIEGLTAP